MREAKAKNFGKLITEVRACTLCKRMCNSARVLSFAAGNLHSELMFIGEAPGRLGADQTEVPFHGDTAGKNFEGLLELAGIHRDEVFITNAVLCNPKDDDGNNATPNGDELKNCAAFLRRQIEMVAPSIVVTLGVVALRATALIEPHNFSLGEHVRTSRAWFNRLLVPLYHPGQRAMVHRSLANQRSDYQVVAEQWRRLGRQSRRVSGTPKESILAACKYLLAVKGEVSYFELHKLAYLAEYLHVKLTGRRLTSGFFIRQKDGPYCTDLHIERLRKASSQIQAINRGGKLYVRLGNTASPQLLPESELLESQVLETIRQVISRYSYTSESDLKKAVYLTAPMRAILRRERRDHVNLYNAPIDFLTAG
jgi:uracil-DNA glycosylase family 4